MEEEKDNRQPYLYVGQRTLHGSTQWHCYFVGVEPGTQKITNYCGSYPYSSDHHPLKDLAVHAYFQDAKWLRPGSEPLTGYNLEYRDVFRIDTETAEVMAKTLRKANKELERLKDDLGNCSTFADFVVRCALALKARGFVRPLNNGGWNYEQTEHCFMSAAEAKFFIEHENREYTKKARPDLFNDAA